MVSKKVHSVEIGYERSNCFLRLYFILIKSSLGNTNSRYTGRSEVLEFSPNFLNNTELRLQFSMRSFIWAWKSEIQNKCQAAKDVSPAIFLSMCPYNKSTATKIIWPCLFLEITKNLIKIFISFFKSMFSKAGMILACVLP